MRGWIFLAVIGAGMYYLYTDTNTLDKPIAESRAMIKKIERKLDSMTGTQIIRVDANLQRLKAAVGQRLSPPELAEFNLVLKDKNSVADFKDSFCHNSAAGHPVFDKDNLQFICDNL